VAYYQNYGRRLRRRRDWPDRIGRWIAGLIISLLDGIFIMLMMRLAHNTDHQLPALGFVSSLVVALIGSAIVHTALIKQGD
jgi:hypothetical protein